MNRPRSALLKDGDGGSFVDQDRSRLEPCAPTSPLFHSLGICSPDFDLSAVNLFDADCCSILNRCVRRTARRREVYINVLAASQQRLERQEVQPDNSNYAISMHSHLHEMAVL